MTTKISWCDETWNPITGCSKISPGCKNCYAERMAKRLAGRFGYPADDPFRVTVHPDKIDLPLKWKKPRRIFVCSMGDLFHHDVTLRDLWPIFRIMQRCPQHTFIILTKRPEMMADFFQQWDFTDNLQIGVTAENQEQADKRISILLQIPDVVKFVSVEPMLDHVDLRRIKPWHPAHGPEGADALGGGSWGHPFTRRYAGEDSPGYLNHSDAPTLDLVIAGCESGPGRRSADTDWFRSLRDQCAATGTPFFLKQRVINGKVVSMPELDGRRHAEMPT